MKFLKKVVSGIAIVALCVTAMPYSVSADAGDDTAALKKEMAILKERLSALETRLQQSEVKVAKVEKEKAMPMSEAGIPAAITSFAKEIDVHGSVDTGYIFNTNTPVSPNARTNNLRVFDTEANGFMLNLAELNFEKPISQESPVGFRVDLTYGKDAELFDAAGLGSGTDEFDLQQAYAQFYVPFSLPFMHALNFRIGKYVTLHGAEVIESVDNWNYSRSLLFGYAIPFTHTGIRAYYKPVETWPVEAYIGIVNGWDNVNDNNRAKSLEAMFCYTPFDNLSLTVAGMFGPERAGSNEDFRNLIDTVITFKPFDKLTLKANYDYGWEKNGASATAGLSGDGKDASWDGIAGYAKYDILDWWSIAGRGEFFHDRNGVRTGQLTSATMPMTDVEIWEFTLTNEFKLYNNLITRLEYRYDKANGQVYTKDKITANYQGTVAAEVIYKF